MSEEVKDLPRIKGVSRLRIESDGPGIRTLVPISGCNLNCAWCINNELRSPLEGDLYSPKDLLEVVKLDDIYFRVSGGGITFGGGEPLLHSEFIRRFCEICPAEWSIAVESSLYVPEDAVERLIGVVDGWIIDIKETDMDRYEKYTGAKNDVVFSNLTLLWERVDPESVVIRIPMIKGLNTPEDVAKSESTCREIGFETESVDYVDPESLCKSHSDRDTYTGEWFDPERLSQEERDELERDLDLLNPAIKEGSSDMIRKGKRKCDMLREIRRQVCKLNGLVYNERECTLPDCGCNGTCPVCDAQLRHINRQLEEKAIRGESICYEGLNVIYNENKE